MYHGSAEGHNRAYDQWYIAGQVAVNVLLDVLPHLLSKKRQAKLAVQCWKERVDLRPYRKNKSITSEERVLRGRITHTERTRRANIRRAISDLNQGVK